MKNYNKPTLEMISFISTDIITTSSTVVLSNFARDLAEENTEIKAYDFKQIFGS